MANTNRNRYLYDGKELQDLVVGVTAFGWYDYGARFYDPELPHFTSLDPIAEKHYEESTYIYCGSNPINRIDPDGQDWYRSADGNTVTWRKGSEEIEDYKNIGTTYTQSIGNGVSVTYN